MWLINVRTYKLEYFHNEQQVKYAILSHRWGTEEITYDIMKRETHDHETERLNGWYKTWKSCEQARADELEYAWVDTCCIDKSSSAELQEAINSMFRWYRCATVCYVYLSDVTVQREIPTPPENVIETYGMAISKSEWFKRGWTLQELIAPHHLIFFDTTWVFMGTRLDHVTVLSQITRIRLEILRGKFTPQETACIAEVMCWAVGRATTRIEDRAYSLLGLFGVNMPMLYGEGHMAFRRLQEEILRRTNDQSIFLWPMEVRPDCNHGTLATSPDAFSTRLQVTHLSPLPSGFGRRMPYAITNEGISLEVDLVPYKPRIYLATLNFSLHTRHEHKMSRAAIYVKRLDSRGRYSRWYHPDANDRAELGAGLALYSPGPRYWRRQIHLVDNLIALSGERHWTDEIVAFSVSELSLNTSFGSTILNPSPTNGLSGTDCFRKLKYRLEFAEETSNMDAIKRTGAGAVAGSITISGVLCSSSDSSNWSPFCVRLIVFGFDFDFNPTLIIFLADSEDYPLNPSAAYQALEAPYELQEEVGTINTKCRVSVTGAVWQFIEPNMVVIRTKLLNRDHGVGFSALLIPKGPEFKKDILVLNVSRKDIYSPWDFYFGVLDARYSPQMRDWPYLKGGKAENPREDSRT